MKRLIFIFAGCLLYANVANASPWTMCMERVLGGQSGVNFVADIKDFTQIADTDSPEELQIKIQNKSSQIKNALIGVMFNTEIGVCNDLLLNIAKQTDLLALDFRANTRDGIKTVRLQFSADDLLRYYPVATGIVVSNQMWTQYQVISRDYIAEKTWPDGCSDYLLNNPFDSVRDSDPVNKAGQKLSGRTNDEFFLDEPNPGRDIHAFPGLLIADITRQDAAELISFASIPYGIEQTQKFADSLRGTQCQGLNVYYVSYYSTPTSNSARVTDGAATVAGYAIGGAAAVQALSTGIAIAAGKLAAATATAAGAATATTPAVAATAGIGAGVAKAFAISGGAATIPGVGWIVGGAIAAVAGTVAGITAIAVEQIADLPSITVLDGPYPI